MQFPKPITPDLEAGLKELDSPPWIPFSIKSWPRAYSATGRNRNDSIVFPGIVTRIRGESMLPDGPSWSEVWSRGVTVW